MSNVSSGSKEESSSLRVFTTPRELLTTYTLIFGDHPASNEGVNYMLTIIDDFSKRFWSFFLKHKSNVFATFKEWKIMIEK